MDAHSQWDDWTLDAGDECHLELGELRLALERRGSEVWIKPHWETARPRPGSGEWERWAIHPEAEIRIRPAVPDRLVVVAHEYSMNLSPGVGARVYVRLPLNVRIVSSGGPGGEYVLADLPSSTLSDTWWGTFVEGELAYWMATKARSAVTPDLFVPDLVLCPFQLTNESTDSLTIERFAVRAPHLSIFVDGEQAWTDEIRVTYEAADEGSRIDFMGVPPEECPNGRLLAPPREAPPRGFRARTFGRLAALPGFGS